MNQYFTIPMKSEIDDARPINATSVLYVLILKCKLQISDLTSYI